MCTDDDVQDKPSTASIDYLVEVRENAHPKLIEAPSLVLGLLQDKKQDGQAIQEAKATPQELQDFCQASNLGSPLTLAQKDAKAALKAHLERVLLKGSAAISHTSFLFQLTRFGYGRAPQSRGSSSSDGFSSWIVWSSALAATCAIGYILLQRTGWLSAHSSTSYAHSYVRQGAERVRPIF